MKLEICFNQFLGNCLKCTRDLDTTHHPNNYDCPRYKPIYLETFEVKREVQNEINRRN